MADSFHVLVIRHRVGRITERQVGLVLLHGVVDEPAEPRDLVGNLGVGPAYFSCSRW
jgi:hypothetical protein